MTKLDAILNLIDVISDDLALMNRLEFLQDIKSEIGLRIEVVEEEL